MRGPGQLEDSNQYYTNGKLLVDATRVAVASIAAIAIVPTRDLTTQRRPSVLRAH